MYKYALVKKVVIYSVEIIFFLTGCAPGPPLPPFLPGLGWLVAGLAIGLGIILWKKNTLTAPVKTHYVTEILNTINQHLQNLEKRMNQLEKKLDQNIKQKSNK